MRARGTGSIINKPGTSNFYVRYYVDGKQVEESTGTSDRSLAETFLIRRVRNRARYHRAIDQRRQRKSAVYALFDPRTYHLRYVGVTALHPRRRVQNHLPTTGTNIRMKTWLGELKIAGLKPAILTLAEVDHATGADAEQHWIAKLRECGHDLLNANVGGSRGSLKFPSKS
jgi:hypothetical protein